MSVLTDYLKLIPTAIKNADKIIEGIVNKVENDFGILPEDEQKEIARRMLICKECPFMSSNSVAIPELNYKTNRLDEHCSVCGCNLILKTSSLLSNCGLEVWNTNHPENQIPLKWETYERNKN